VTARGANRQPTLFDADRLGLGDSIGLTVESLREYGPRYDHWAVAFSGGKDSTTLLTLVLHLIRSGRVTPPGRLTVCYADTRMELPPLAVAAREILAASASEGYDVRVVLPPMDDRFFVYMFGRGVPPPTNRFRWCTGQIKVEPMEAEVARLTGDSPGKVLMLTGVRQGESAARDGRIAMSCGKDGAECGQGWYQEALSGEHCDTLAPILHWRTCLVWDWLSGLLAPEWRHGYPTRPVAEAYGLAEEGSAAEINARTGCNGCPLATRDSALDNLLRSPRWAYLSPLKDLRPLYRWLREPSQRLRKAGFEEAADGAIRWTNRMGPLTMAARREGLARVLDIQARCNAASPPGMPGVDTLDAEEVARIGELIEANTWPNRWSGEEPTGDEPFERVTTTGVVQRSFLLGLESD
jgi:DNA sulfur modification protein DndC